MARSSATCPDPLRVAPLPKPRGWPWYAAPPPLFPGGLPAVSPFLRGSVCRNAGEHPPVPARVSPGMQVAATGSDPAHQLPFPLLVPPTAPAKRVASSSVATRASPPVLLCICPCNCPVVIRTPGVCGGDERARTGTSGRGLVVARHEHDDAGGGPLPLPPAPPNLLFRTLLMSMPCVYPPSTLYTHPPPTNSYRSCRRRSASLPIGSRCAGCSTGWTPKLLMAIWNPRWLLPLQPLATFLGATLGSACVGGRVQGCSPPCPPCP